MCQLGWGRLEYGKSGITCFRFWLGLFWLKYRQYRDEMARLPLGESCSKVKRLGPKAFEQAAGFLRVKGKEILDGSAVHPERYKLVKQMAKDANCTVAD